MSTTRENNEGEGKHAHMSSMNNTSCYIENFSGLQHDFAKMPSKRYVQQYGIDVPSYCSTADTKLMNRKSAADGHKRRKQKQKLRPGYRMRQMWTTLRKTKRKLQRNKLGRL